MVTSTSPVVMTGSKPWLVIASISLSEAYWSRKIFDTLMVPCFSSAFLTCTRSRRTSLRMTFGPSTKSAMFFAGCFFLRSDLNLSNTNNHLLFQPEKLNGVQESLPGHAFLRQLLYFSNHFY